MTSMNKARILKWGIPFVIPEIVCVTFFVSGLISQNYSLSGTACTLAMVYIWFYTIIFAIAVSPAVKKVQKNKED